MRLLANENFPGPAVDALRAAGHDVLWARTHMPGEDAKTGDERVLVIDVADETEALSAARLRRILAYDVTAVVEPLESQTRCPLWGLFRRAISSHLAACR